MKTLPENYKIVQGVQPKTTSSAVVGDYVSLKNVDTAYVLVNLTQAVGHATAITIEKATAVAGTGTTPITVAVPVWANEDVAASDTLVRAADAVGYTVTNDVKNKQVLFQIDPATLGDTFTSICVKSAASSQATNLISVDYILETKYAQATPPSAIID